MNNVHSIVIDLQTGNEEFIHQLYGRWEHFFEKNIREIADRLLMKHDDDSVVIEISGLDIDLGSIAEEDFDRRFPLLLEEKLEEALLGSIRDPQARTLKRTAGTDHLLEILTHFLLHGSLPWHLSQDYEDISFLFTEVMRLNGKELKRFLRTYGHQTSLQERLVYQLNDGALEKGLQLIAPGESTFLKSYISFLREKYKTLTQPVMRESTHREAVWKVVYSYLLTSRSTYFNKKEFLSQTITRLAAHHNLSYETLLFVLTSDPGNLVPVSRVSELFLLLEDLKREVPESRFRQFLSDAISHFKGPGAGAYGQVAASLSVGDRKALFRILSMETTARQFLQTMAEMEITALVKIIVPTESDFVSGYARTLDQQKERGILQGKAGGEFRIVKWQIIFPLLISMSTTSFNRRQFVWSTISRVSARYNFSVSELLDYLCSDAVLQKLRPDLGAVLQSLYSESVGKEAVQKTAIRSEVDLVLEKVRERKELNSVEREALMEQFYNAPFREKVLSVLRETARLKLVRMLFPEEALFIISYARGLESSRTYGELEGKTGGSFTRMKWTFIYTVLFESRNVAFNRKQFVSQTIRKTAAHYNTYFKELLTFFYKEIGRSGIAFPYDLVKIIEELYTEQQLPAQSAEQTGKAKIHAAEEKTIRSLHTIFGKSNEVNMMIAQLSEKPEFLRYIRTVIEQVKLLQRLVVSWLNASFDTLAVLRMLIRFSENYRDLSQKVMIRQLVLLVFEQLTIRQQYAFRSKMVKGTSTHHLLAAVKLPPVEAGEKVPEQETITENNMQENEEHHGEPAYLKNAGMVLMSPFFPGLFSKLSLTETGKFKDRDAQIRGMFLLQYAVFGTEEFPEHELQLNKLLTGFETGIPIPRTIGLTEEEKSIVHSLLNGVLEHWGRLAKTSVEGLREAFLQREGQLVELEDHFLLTVGEKSFDMLLDSLPWNFKTIRLGWMKKAIMVKWR